jgi:predicted nuclease of predicted toxin-antitoxin system
VKFKLDENLPVSSAAILTSAGHDVDTVTEEGLVGAPDRDVVAAATAAGRILISLDRGLGDIRAYPPGSHAGIVVLRLTDQSAAAATRRSATWPASPILTALPGRWRSCSADYCASATRNQASRSRAFTPSEQGRCLHAASEMIPRSGGPIPVSHHRTVAPPARNQTAPGGSRLVLGN